MHVYVERERERERGRCMCLHCWFRKYVLLVARTCVVLAGCENICITIHCLLCSLVAPSQARSPLGARRLFKLIDDA